jgi:hypothetical protein
MRKIPSLAMATAILVTGMFAGCDNSGSGSSTGSDTTGSTWSGTWDTSYTYSSKIVGSTIVVTGAQTTITAYCGTLAGYYDSYGKYVAGAPVIKFDTSVASPDTTVYKVLGSKLLIGGQDTSTLSGGTKIVYWTIFTRNSGSGLIGTWTSTFAESLEVVGTAYPTDSIQKVRERSLQTAAAEAQSGFTDQVTISANSLSARIHYGNMARFEAAIYAGESYFDGLQIVATSPTTVVFTGKTTHEVVTETFLSRTTIRYSSSDSISHPTYTEYGRPTDVSQCPANAWFYTFISANQPVGSAGRRLAGSGQTAVRRNLSGLFGLPALP